MNHNEFTAAGTFLVKCWLIGPIKGEDGLLKLQNDAVGVTIGFTTVDKDQILEHDFWIPSEEYVKFSQALDIQKGKKIGEQIVNKELWMCVREVHENGQIRYEPFDWIKCDDPNVRPIISGDPIQHPEGKPLGVFLKRENIFTKKLREQNEAGKGLSVTEPLNAAKMLQDEQLKARLEEGRKIIEDVKNKKSVETSEDDPWANM